MSQLFCPECKTIALIPNFLEKLLSTQSCPNCYGHWLLIENFVIWQRDYGKQMSEVEPLLDREDHQPSKKLLICPITKKIMHKFPIHESVNHTLNFSVELSGVWLSRYDWQLIKSLDLGQSLNKIFTPAWQNRVKQNQTQMVFEQRYIQRFGQEDYEKLKSFKLWMDEHSERDAMISFLSHKNPWHH